MVNKKQASFILRVIKPEVSYYVQIRDNIGNAGFRFPGFLSLFGGEIEEGEKGIDGFMREAKEELEGLNIKCLNLKQVSYNWKNDLEKVDKEIDNYLNGNFDILRGFDYDSLIPEEALGKDKGRKMTYRDLFYALEEDHYFAADIDIESINGIKVKEGKRGILLPADLCAVSLFYPTDKIALMHDLALLRKKI